MRTATPSAKSDRRRSPREGHVVESWLSRYESGERVEMTNFDISRHGVSFDSTTAIPVGAHYTYEIGIGEQSLVCNIRIVNCQQVENDIWHMGAEFI
jgi:hypothetical protein